MLELSRTATLPDDLGTDVISITAGDPVQLEVRMESVVEGVLVTGSVNGTATGACVRCLDPVELDVDGNFQELFAYADRAAHHHEVGADSDETRCTSWSVTSSTSSPCSGRRRPDAAVPTGVPAGLSGIVFRMRDAPGGRADHHHEVIDPRWSSLSGLLGNDPQEKRN